jgi:5-hydroxyisourate hydrolase
MIRRRLAPADRQDIDLMGQLTTHVLDTSAGLPAAGVRIELLPLDTAAPEPTVRITGIDGRCAPLLAGEGLRAGRYALTFDTAAYFRGRGVALPEPAFIEQVLIRIGIADPSQHYHVPLLISPWSYSVYRGG